MQLAVRVAATFLALTWIVPVAQAATAARDFTLIDGTGRNHAPGAALIVDGRRLRHIPTHQRKSQPELARVYIARAGVEQQTRK